MLVPKHKVMCNVVIFEVPAFKDMPVLIRTSLQVGSILPRVVFTSFIQHNVFLLGHTLHKVPHIFHKCFIHFTLHESCFNESLVKMKHNPNKLFISPPLQTLSAEEREEGGGQIIS